MRNMQEFESLVFERADIIRRRDRKVRIIRMSVLPTAAAFAILTAVGIRTLTAGRSDYSGAVRSQKNVAEKTTAVKEKTDVYNEFDAAYADAANDAEEADDHDDYDAVYNEKTDEAQEYSYDMKADAAEAQNGGDATNGETEAVTVGFYRDINDRDPETLLTDADQTREIVGALTGESAERGKSEQKGVSSDILAAVKITNGSGETKVYYIKQNEAEVEIGGEYAGTIALDDNAKSVLSKYFDIDFDKED